MEQTSFVDQVIRVLNGNTPAIFFIEVIIRALVIYVVLIAALRFMGKRMASRLSRNELAAMATLAAAIGMPIQTPDRGLLPAIVMTIIVLLVQRFIAARSVKKKSFERLTQGDISLLVQDACLQPHEMIRTNMSRDRLFSMLRTQRIRHLGEVKRLYLEASGAFTLIRATEAKPGLCILPKWDADFIAEQQQVKDHTVCHYCGVTVATPHTGKCPNCGRNEFVPAIN
jgi:uncharacterized membrane protein YcaP (DUF421 family)